MSDVSVSDVSVSVREYVDCVCACVCVCECVCSKLTFPVEPPSVHRMVDVSWPGTVFVAPGKIYVAVALYLCVCACVLAHTHTKTHPYAHTTGNEVRCDV